MKNYKIKPNKQQLEIMKNYWASIEKLENDFWDKKCALEKSMEEDTSIKGIEFFFCDGACVGIGNVERTMELIQEDEFKEVKMNDNAIKKSVRKSVRCKRQVNKSKN